MAGERSGPLTFLEHAAAERIAKQHNKPSSPDLRTAFPLLITALSDVLDTSWS